MNRYYNKTANSPKRKNIPPKMEENRDEQLEKW